MWLNPDLAAKWADIRRVRSVVTGALEVQRRDKVIGASLEAAPIVYVGSDLEVVLSTVPLDDICITSAITVDTSMPPEGAFTLDGVEGIAVSFAEAKGEKCQRCWKILPDVGTHSHPGTCQRCDAALG